MIAGQAQETGGHPQAAQGLAGEKASMCLKTLPNTHRECGVIEISLTNVLRELRRPGLGEPRRLSGAGTRTGGIQLCSTRGGRGAGGRRAGGLLHLHRGTAANTETVNLDNTMSISPIFVHSVSLAFNKTHCYRKTKC